MSACLLTRLAPCVLASLLAPSCTLISLESEDSPPGLEADGLIEGHLAFGIRDEDQFLRLDLFDGSSPGAVGELTLWKLFRLELGLAGAAIGLGPIDLALGTLAYDPELPDYHRPVKYVHRPKGHSDEDAEDDPEDQGEHVDG
ncbi:MAG: hypothetical protein AAF682_07220 [Planctomycetota bacterium]